jgi:hypothetical protein
LDEPGFKVSEFQGFKIPDLPRSVCCILTWLDFETLQHGNLLQTVTIFDATNNG